MASEQRCLRPATYHLRFLATYHLLQLRLMLEGELEQRVVTLEPEFLADIGAMIFDRTVMDEQLLRYRFARFALCHHTQDAALRRREIGQFRLFRGERLGAATTMYQISCERRRDVVVALGHRPKCVHDLRQGTIF